MDVLSFSFMVEKIKEHGEDSEPLLFIDDNLKAVGVFDGMGGAGATLCKSDYGLRTKAYVASRITKESVENLLKMGQVSSESMAQKIQLRLEQEKVKYPSEKSGLRSKLVKDYPTTLAVATIVKSQNKFVVTSYWAGDSRNYLWTPTGFYQMSKDDLVSEFDPLENLKNDDMLSNCVCAGQDFVINKLEKHINGPFVLFSATDGCFNYFLTPMHFEYVMKDSLRASSDMDTWREILEKKLQGVTADDMSMALIAIGFKDFAEMKEQLSITEVKGLTKILGFEKDISDLEEWKLKLTNQLGNAINEGWQKYYKDRYLSLLNSKE